MVITVTCPSCGASFPVDSNKIPAAGVNARCSTCRYVFRIERPMEPPPPPPEEYHEPEPIPSYEPPPARETPARETPAFETPAFEAPPEAPGPPDTDFSVGTESAGSAAGTREWVYEQEERIDPESLDIQPMEAAEPAPFAPPPFEVAPPPPPPSAPPPPPEPEPAQPSVGSFTFGRRDPTDKARRLARVLVSDMIMYNPKRHEQALANGTLKQDFEDEIAKSWKEYVEQVGEEMATANTFWADALNDVLAKGQKVF